MPLYEYECSNCGDVFELIQKFSDEPLTTHEKCGGPVHRLISTSALQFKGSGWYVNDYARAGKSGESGAAKGGEGSDSGAKKSESGEAKPAGSGSDSSSSTAPSAPAKSESKSTSESKSSSSDKQ